MAQRPSAGVSILSKDLHTELYSLPVKTESHGSEVGPLQEYSQNKVSGNVIGDSTDFDGFDTNPCVQTIRGNKIIDYVCTTLLYIFSNL